MGVALDDRPSVPTVKRNDVNVKIDADVARWCKIVSSSRGVPMAEYLSELVRPMVQRDLKAEMGRQLGPSRGTTPTRRPKGGES